MLGRHASAPPCPSCPGVRERTCVCLDMRIFDRNTSYYPFFFTRISDLSHLLKTFLSGDPVKKSDYPVILNLLQNVTTHEHADLHVILQYVQQHISQLASKARVLAPGCVVLARASNHFRISAGGLWNGHARQWDPDGDLG